jgi:hypothetical protein
MDPTRTLLAIVAPLVPPAYAIQRDGRTSAEVARERLLWCQHNDPVTRPNRKRMFREFAELAGYVRKPKWPTVPYPSHTEYRNGKPVQTTQSRLSALRGRRIWW